MAQYCASCGTPLTPMNQFCPRCGRPTAMAGGGMGMGGQGNPQNLISALGATAENKSQVTPPPGQPQMGYGGYPQQPGFPPQGPGMYQQPMGYQQPGFPPQGPMQQPLPGQPGAFSGMPGQGMVQGAMNAVGQMLGGGQQMMGQAFGGVQNMAQGAMQGLGQMMGRVPGMGGAPGMAGGPMGGMGGGQMGQMAGTAATALGAAALGAAAMGLFNKGQGGPMGGGPMGGGMPQQGGLSAEQQKDPFAALGSSTMSSQQEETKPQAQAQPQPEPQAQQPIQQQAPVQPAPTPVQAQQPVQQQAPVPPQAVQAAPQQSAQPQTVQVATQAPVQAQPIIPPQPDLSAQPVIAPQPEIPPAPDLSVSPPQPTVEAAAQSEPAPVQAEPVTAQVEPVTVQMEAAPQPEVAAAPAQPEPVQPGPAQAFTLPTADTAPAESPASKRDMSDDEFDDVKHTHDDDPPSGGAAGLSGGFKTTGGNGQGMSLVSPIVATEAVVAAGAAAAAAAMSAAQSQSVQPAQVAQPPQQQGFQPMQTPTGMGQPQTFGTATGNAFGMGAGSSAAGLRTAGAASGLGAVAGAAAAIMRVFASAMPGEQELGGFQPLAVLPQGIASVASILNPFRTVILMVRRVFTAIPTMFRSKKAFAITLGTAAVWLAQILLRNMGTNPLPLRILQGLTFANGTMGRGVIGIVGGLLGQGTVAAAIVSLFYGGFGRMTAGARTLFSSGGLFGGSPAGGRQTGVAALGSVLMGTGASMLAFMAFTGFPVAGRSMAGVAGLALSLQALGGRGGNLRMLATSLTSMVNPMNGTRTAQPEMATAMLSGSSLGFAASTLLALLPVRIVSPLVIGIVLLAAGGILWLAGKNTRPAMQTANPQIGMMGQGPMQSPGQMPGSFPRQ